MDLFKIKGLLLVHIVLIIVVGNVEAEISQNSNKQNLDEGTKGLSGPSSAKESWKKDCSKSYSSMCLKLDVISLVDRLAESNDFEILPGVSVVKQNDNKTTSTSTTSAEDVVANLTHDFPNDADKRTNAYLAHKIGAYFSSHAISIRLFDPRTAEATRSFNEAALERLGLAERRDNNSNNFNNKNDGNSSSNKDNVATGRKKDKGGNQGMMAALMMMKGTMGALAFGALAMLAGKALMTGLMALMLSAIVGLKSLAGGEKKTTYEIISKPVHTSASYVHSSEEASHHGGYVGGYARTLDDVQAVQESVKVYGNVHDRRAAADFARGL